MRLQVEVADSDSLSRCDFAISDKRNGFIVCVEPRTSALDITALARAADIDRYLIPTPELSSKPAARSLLLSIDGTDRQTDGHPHRIQQGSVSKLTEWRAVVQTWPRRTSPLARGNWRRRR